MPSIAQPMDTWTRLETRSDGPIAGADAADTRPVLPAFMDRRRSDVLSSTIVEQIVPRLVLARGAQTHPPSEGHGACDVEGLVQILLTEGLPEAVVFVNQVSARGVAVETIYLDLLAASARRLGAMWDDDLCDFVAVTIGLGRLRQVLCGLSAPFQDDPHRQGRRRRILLVPAPGDDHSFGLSMVASFFQRAGWSGWAGKPATTAELVRMVRDESFAVVGFSASCLKRADALATAIRAVRRASINRDIRVMVGGPLFIEHPELMGMVGADATATDGRQAVLQAQNLLTLIPSRV